MPAATATLRLSTPSVIGIETVASAASSQRAETPFRSLPTTSATAPVRSSAQ